MQKAAADPEVRAVIEYREKAELDYLNGMVNAKHEGILLIDMEKKLHIMETAFHTC